MGTKKLYEACFREFLNELAFEMRDYYLEGNYEAAVERYRKIFKNM